MPGGKVYSIWDENIGDADQKSSNEYYFYF